MAEFIATTNIDRFVGKEDDDYFYFTRKFMASADEVDGGGGTNAVVLWNDTASIWKVSSLDWPKISNIQGIALVSRNTDGYDQQGFNLTFDNTFFKMNKVSQFTIDAYRIGLDYGRLQLNASTVTNMSFDIYGSSGYYFDDLGEQPSYDFLRTGSRDDRFIYYANSLAQDGIDGGEGTDTILLVGAGRTTSKNGKETTDPKGVSTLDGIKNIEKVVVTDLSAGQTRAIDFGYGGVSRARNTIIIETNSNYGTDKAAAPVDGKLIVDGSGIKSILSRLYVKGGNGADLMIGGAADDRLFGGDGNDTLVNGYGSDRLSGGRGNDTFFSEVNSFHMGYEFLGGVTGKLGVGEMYGGEGDDVFYFGLPYETSRLNVSVLSGGTGTDTLRLGSRSTPKDIFDSVAVSGIEVVDLENVFSNFTLSLKFIQKNHDKNGILWIQNIEGMTGGIITIDASAATDARYSVHIAVRSPGSELLTGGAGDDIFDYSLVTSRYLEKHAKSGLTVGDVITGGGGYDKILVPEGRKTGLGSKVTGVEELRIVNKSTAGDTTEIGLANFKAITVNGSGLSANDSLIAQGSFTDGGHFYQARASILIISGKGDDILSGGRANDKLRGGDGDDVLTGNKGADRLAGGKGSDQFVFAAVSDSLPKSGGRDVITDFKQSEGDKIHFLHEGPIAYSFIGSNAFHGKAGEVRSATSNGKTYIHLDEDGDGITDMSIMLIGKMPLTQNDFIL